MISGKIQVAAAIAVLALSLNSASAAPTFDSDMEFVARSGIGSKIVGIGSRVGKDIAHSVGTDEMRKKINSHVNPPPHIHPGLAAAAKKATAHHDPKLVAAAVAHAKMHHKRDLDLEEDLFERDFGFEDELDARSIGSKISRVGGNLVKEYAQNSGSSELHKKINSYVNPPVRVHPGLVEAGKRITGPHDPKLVSAALAHTRLHHHKRDIEDLVDLLVTRAMELEFDDLE